MRFVVPGLLVASLLTLSLGACLPSLVGAFSADGFHSAQFPYAVHYTSPATKEFLGPDWRIDNYYIADDGSIGDPKTTDAYRGREAVDLLGDGKLTKWTTNYFDLKLDNRKTSGVIWVQTVQLGRKDAERNLRNLVEDYAEALSGSGFFAVVNDGRVIKAKTYAAKIVDGKDRTLGGLPAYDAHLELANLDQVRLDPSARAAIIRVVLVKTDYVSKWGEDAMPLNPDHVAPESRVLIRIGYRASPSDFEAGLPDFERFLTLLQFDPAKRESEGGVEGVPVSGPPL
jgi:hypothetical protein